MDESILESSIWIRRKDMDYSSGQTDDNMKENGSKGSSMGSGNVLIQMARKRVANGNMGNELNGCDECPI